MGNSSFAHLTPIDSQGTRENYKREKINCRIFDYLPKLFKLSIRSFYGKHRGKLEIFRITQYFLEGFGQLLISQVSDTLPGDKNWCWLPTCRPVRFSKTKNLC